MMWYLGLSLVALVSSASYNFGGQFGEQCGADGIYYRDATSFTVCVDGVATIQRCAPGSQNSASSSFQFGSRYGGADFCDVNLGDTGHATSNNKGYGNQGNSGHRVYNTEISGNTGYNNNNRYPHGNGYNRNRHQVYGSYNTPINTYQGKFNGRCVQDGIYYNDRSSFVLCSGGAPSFQPCAPGTENQGFSSFILGGSYDVKEFCGVNLVDTGYGVNTAGYGNAQPSIYGSSIRPHRRNSNAYGNNKKDIQQKGYGNINPVASSKGYGNGNQVAPSQGYGKTEQATQPDGYGTKEEVAHPQGYGRGQ